MGCLFLCFSFSRQPDLRGGISVASNVLIGLLSDRRERLGGRRLPPSERYITDFRQVQLRLPETRGTPRLRQPQTFSPRLGVFRKIRDFWSLVPQPVNDRILLASSDARLAQTLTRRLYRLPNPNFIGMGRRITLCTGSPMDTPILMDVGD